MDTVILKIYGPGKFDFRNMSAFLPELKGRNYEDLSPTEQISKKPYLRKYILQLPKQEIYFPRVEVYETLSRESKNVHYVLKVEFSIPKLLYGNSVQEVTSNPNNEIFSILSSRLSKAAIIISPENLANARVSAIHFCKNIPLPREIKIQDILSELRKLDIDKTVDVTSTRFKNGGNVLNIYCGTREHCFYDKVSDSMRPKNKRTDKDLIDYQRSYVVENKLSDQEIFRYEYRIKHTQAVKSELNKYLGRDLASHIKFVDLFTPNLAQEIIITSWDRLTRKAENQISLFKEPDNLSLLLHLLSEVNKLDHKAHSMNTVFITYGLVLAIREHGAKQIKNSINNTWNDDHPERLTKKIQTAVNLMSNLPFSDNISFLDKELRKEKIVTLNYL